MAEANAAEASGLRGAAGAIELPEGVFTGRSTGAGGGALNPEVQAAFDAVPANLRSPFHGKCCEARALSEIKNAGINPAGGRSIARTVGGAKHGAIKAACTSCEWVLRFFGVIDGA